MSETPSPDHQDSEKKRSKRARSVDPATDISAESNDASEPKERSTAGSADIAPGSELAEALREKDQFKALLQRTQADFINFRSRVENEKTEIRRTAKRSLISRLLEVMDNLDAALSDDATAGVDAKFVEGVDAVRRGFVSVFGAENVEYYESLGKQFDPRLHEALSRIETADHEPGTVVQVHRAGYKMGDDVLRPALVAVAVAIVNDESGSS